MEDGRMSASENALGTKSAATVEELVAATKDTGVRRIAVRGDLANAPSIRLSPGQSLHGEGDGARICASSQSKTHQEQCILKSSLISGPNLSVALNGQTRGTSS